MILDLELYTIFYILYTIFYKLYDIYYICFGCATDPDRSWTGRRQWSASGRCA